MSERRDQAGPTQQPKRTLLGYVDDHRILRLAIADERDHAFVASGRGAHATALTADRERHGDIVTRRCDGQTGAGYLGPMVHAFVLIDGLPSRVADLAVELAGIEGVSEVYSVAGHADIVAVVRVRKHEDLAEVVTRRISRLDGVVDTRTLIAFQAYSAKDLDAIWDLGAE